jgi:hypothetical protein
MVVPKEETAMNVLPVLLIAAASGAPSGASGPPLAPPPLLHPPVALACAHLANRTAGPHGAPFRRLGDLPPAQLEHAILRSIGGCPVREIVLPGGVRYIPDGNPSVRKASPGP